MTEGLERGGRRSSSELQTKNLLIGTKQERGHAVSALRRHMEGQDVSKCHGLSSICSFDGNIFHEWTVTANEDSGRVRLRGQFPISTIGVLLNIEAFDIGDEVSDDALLIAHVKGSGGGELDHDEVGIRNASQTFFKIDV